MPQPLPPKTHTALNQSPIGWQMVALAATPTYHRPQTIASEPLSQAPCICKAHAYALRGLDASGNSRHPPPRHTHTNIKPHKGASKPKDTKHVYACPSCPNSCPMHAPPPEIHTPKAAHRKHFERKATGWAPHVNGLPAWDQCACEYAAVSWGVTLHQKAGALRCP